MESKILKIGEAIKTAWHTITSRFGFWAGLIGITLVVGLIPAIVAHYMGVQVVDISVPHAAIGAAAKAAGQAAQTGPTVETYTAIEQSTRAATRGGVHILNLINLLLGTFLTLGWVNVAVKQAYGEAVGYKDFFLPMKSGKKFFSLLVGTILYGLIVFAGIILLVFPAFIWGTRYSLFSYYIVRHNMGPIDALRASAATTLNGKLDLLALFLLLALLNIAGFFVLFVGYLVTAVLTELAKAQAFKALHSQTKLPAELSVGSDK
jgi:hypothetical protein